jgi:hypothetical protein
MWSKQKLMFVAIKYQQYLDKQARPCCLPDITLSFVALAVHVGHDLGDKSTVLLM